MAHIFISCSSADKVRAKELHDRLSNDFDVWLFTEKLLGGIKWSSEIDSALAKADALIVLISPSSAVSQWVTYEWSFALGKNLAVIPLQIEVVERDKIHDKLKELHIISFVSPRDEDWSSLFRRIGEVSLRGEIVRLRKLEVTITTAHEYRVRQLAIREVAKISDHAHANRFIPVLIQSLKSDSEFLVRLEAAEAVGILKAKAAVSTLIEALADKESAVRGPAATALGLIGDKRAVPSLLLSLYDEEYVRELAAAALGEIRDVKAIPELVKLLDDKSARVRCSVADALGNFGDAARSAVPKLVQFLDDFENVYSDVRVCDSAAEALRKIRTIEGLEAVRQWEQTS